MASVGRWLIPLLFVLASLPLIIQDIRSYSVSLVLLIVIFFVWVCSAVLMVQGTGRLVASGLVLLIGAAMLNVFPERLGEADVIYMSGMASIFDFWHLMIALALGCIAGLAAFVWGSRGSRKEHLALPIPFLPSLYWGGLTVILGGLLY